MASQLAVLNIRNDKKSITNQKFPCAVAAANDTKCTPKINREVKTRIRHENTNFLESFEEKIGSGKWARNGMTCDKRKTTMRPTTSMLRWYSAVEDIECAVNVSGWLTNSMCFVVGGFIVENRERSTLVQQRTTSEWTSEYTYKHRRNTTGKHYLKITASPLWRWYACERLCGCLQYIEWMVFYIWLWHTYYCCLSHIFALG